MNSFVKLGIYSIGSLVFGPLLAIYLTFFGDFYTLSLKYKFLENISDDWDIVLHFVFFWISFYCMLSFFYECRKIKNKPPKLDWWQTEVIYQIYVRSFFDSTDNGSGDLQGIIKKLDYIKSLGMKAIWITPIYPSGGKDGGYDITSLTEIDPLYGTMEDFDELVHQVHKRDMYLLLDFIPNHTSNLHQWFKESCKNDPDNPYRDFYVWYPSEDKINPPNNWISVFGESAWTYNENRKAWYLHQFLKEQPDLNFRCEAVRKEIEKSMRFWLEDKNVDGFRIDALRHLFEDKNFDNEPMVDNLMSKKIEYSHLKHTKTADQPETYQLLSHWRSIFDEISSKTKRTKALIVECTSELSSIGKYYFFDNRPNANFALNFQFCSMDKNGLAFEPNNVKKLINDYHKHLPKNCWSNWQLGNHDQKRVATRIGNQNIDLANALNLLVGGTAVVYNGEEIGMEDLPKECLTFDQCMDESGKKYGPEEFSEKSRDYCRSPIQWSDETNAGFSKFDKTWLPVHPNHKFKNIQSQLKCESSHLSIFKNLVNLRQLPSFQWGTYKPVVVNNEIFSFLRKAYGFPPFLVVMNFSSSPIETNLAISSDIAPRAYVVSYIKGLKNHSNPELGYEIKTPLLTKSIKLNAHDLIILTWASSE